MVEFGNIYYFLYILLAVCAIVGLYFILRRRSDKTQKFVLFGILMANFALHFLKLTFPPYVEGLPGSIHKASLENICAVSCVLFPFLFWLPKKSIVHDYVYFIGFMGGFAALVYPTEALGEAAFRFDTLRFYFCHTSLLAVPLLSALIGYRRPRLRKMWVIPLLFCAYQLIILLNELALIKTGVIEATLETFLARDNRNNAFVHGPTPDLDGVGQLLNLFCPRLFRTDVFGLNGGVDFYWPVVWIFLPAVVYFIPVALLVAAPVSAEVHRLLAVRKERKRHAEADRPTESAAESAESI